MSPWKVILATLVIFCSGLITGGIFVKKINKYPGRPLRSTNQTTSSSSPLSLQRAEFMRRLEKQIELKEEQRVKIARIIKESQERTKPMMEKIGPELREEFKKVREQIRAELTPEQKKQFEELLKPRPRNPDDQNAGKKDAAGKDRPHHGTNAPPELKEKP